MALMFALSSELGSAANTSRYLEPLLRGLVPQLTPEMFALIHTIVRKTAHLAEYAILAILVRRALRAERGTRARAPALRPELFAWSWAVAFAMTDEFHQSFVESRGPSAGDVLIDAAGAVLGLSLVVLASRVRAYRASGT
jgi:VanZ family protein